MRKAFPWLDISVTCETWSIQAVYVYVIEVNEKRTRDTAVEMLLI
jgi:hypothetical protein